MGKIRDCSILLKNNEAGVYRPGDTIEGHVLIDVEEEVRITTVNIFVTGRALTKWERFLQDSSTKKGLETYINAFKRLTKENVDVLTVGSHKFDFRFKLPIQGLPSSFEGEHGAIRYWLRLQVDKKFPAIDTVKYRHFTVLANIDVNDPRLKAILWHTNKKTLSKALVFGNAGTVTLRACTDRRAYCPGEKIQVSLEAKNDSSKDCGIVKATLRQNVTFRAGVETREASVPISLVKGSAALEAGKTLSWKAQELSVQLVPPSTARLTCQIILVSYSVHVEIEISMGFNLSVRIPVLIGTIPLGASLPNQSASAVTSPGNLNYKVCQYGIHPFNGSQNDFTSINFKPKTVCVQRESLPATKSEAEGNSLAAAQQTTPKTLGSSAADSSAVPLSPTEETNSANAEKQPLSTIDIGPACTEKRTGPTSSEIGKQTLQQPSVASETEKGVLPQPSVASGTEKGVLPQPSVASGTEQGVLPQPSVASGTEQGVLPQPSVASGTEKVALPQPSVASGTQESAPPQLPETPTTDLPPTYEETMALGTNPIIPTIEAGPIPYHLAEPSGVGSVLLLLYPITSSHLVQASFRRSAANMALHNGQILGCSDHLSLIPANPHTSGVLLYFPSQRASLSWLQNQTTTFPDLASNWWALVSENTTVTFPPGIEPPSQPESLGPKSVVGFTYARMNFSFASKTTKDEATKMLTHVRQVTQQVENHLVLYGSKVMFAWGDWSSFPLSESDKWNVTVRQMESMEKYEAYKKLLAEDPVVKMLFKELFKPFARIALKTKGVTLFQN